VEGDTVLAVDDEGSAAAVAAVVSVADVSAGAKTGDGVPEPVSVDDSPNTLLAMPACPVVLTTVTGGITASVVVGIDAGTVDSVSTGVLVEPDETGCAGADTLESGSPDALAVVVAAGWLSRSSFIMGDS